MAGAVRIVQRDASAGGTSRGNQMMRHISALSANGVILIVLTAAYLALSAAQPHCHHGGRSVPGLLTACASTGESAA